MRMIRIGEGTSDVKGYTRIVGGSVKNDSQFSDFGKDMSGHPKVYISKYDSTAAGAYQITKTNWNDLRFVNWRKTQKINDFSERSQDLYCAYLIIIKRGAFNLIKDGKIEDAIYKCRQEWASFPNSGYGQREEKLEKYIKEYKKYLEEELNRKTTLHIEEGFLKKVFGKGCCREKLSDIKNIEPCEKCKGHINLADESKWVSQFTLVRPNVACQRACLEILKKYGLKEGSGSKVNLIQTVLEENNALVTKNAKEGVDYLDKQLKSSKPILVGVDHTLRKDKTKNKNINELTTDHFIVIVERGCDNGKVFYRYFEVGTYPVNKMTKGTNPNNKLFLEPDNKIIGKSSDGSKTFTITQVRRNIL